MPSELDTLQGAIRGISDRLGLNIKTDVEATLIGTNIEEGGNHGITYATAWDTFASTNESNIVTPNDLQTAAGIIWNQFTPEDTPDLGAFIVVNQKLTSAINNKLDFRNLFEQSGLEHLRPHSWILDRANITQSAAKIIAGSKDQRFMLKSTTLSGGMGIVPIERSEFEERIRQIFVEPFDDSAILVGQHLPVEGWLRYRDDPLLIEEYIASKPIVSEHDGQMYDGTLRIAFMGITNQEKMTLVPICSYWKLPKEPMGHNISVARSVSDIHQTHPSTTVSPEDFAKAFASLEEAMPIILNQRGISV